MSQEHNPGEMNSYLDSSGESKSWFMSIDHKRIGMMYLASLGLFFTVGGLFAMLLRTEMLSPHKVLVGPETFNQMFTLHGAVMVFLVLIPSIPAALGNFVLPLQLGARNVAFPKLNRLSLYLFWLGAAAAMGGTLLGKIDAGWSLFPSLTLGAGSAVGAMTVALFLLGLSAMMTSVNFLVTVHHLRAPGMTWFRMPLFVWGLYANALVQVLATPVLLVTLLLLSVEHFVGVGIFNANLGGDPTLYQHFFWFYSHPAVFVMILPAMGVVSELIAAGAGKRILGYQTMVFTSLAIAALSFLAWGQHLFVSGQSVAASVVFSFMSLLILIPISVKVGNWLGTLFQGSIQWNTPTFYAFNFLVLFTIGALAGVFLGALPTGSYLHGSSFVVAQMHYTMMGGTMMAMLGGVYFWWPKMTGKMFNDGLGKMAAVLLFVGFNLSFFTQFLLGAQGMPRRYYFYLEQFQTEQQVSTVGAYILGLGLLLVLWNLIDSLRSGPVAPANPWGAKTLEWTATTTPPVENNFIGQPVVNAEAYAYGTAEDSQ